MNWSMVKINSDVVSSIKLDEDTLWSGSSLPSAYRSVNSIISSNGYQYIDTGYAPQMSTLTNFSFQAILKIKSLTSKRSTTVTKYSYKAVTVETTTSTVSYRETSKVTGSSAYTESPENNIPTYNASGTIYNGTRTLEQLFPGSSAHYYIANSNVLYEYALIHTSGNEVFTGTQTKNVMTKTVYTNVSTAPSHTSGWNASHTEYIYDYSTTSVTTPDTYQDSFGIVDGDNKWYHRYDSSGQSYYGLTSLSGDSKGSKKSANIRYILSFTKNGTVFDVLSNDSSDVTSANRPLVFDTSKNIFLFCSNNNGTAGTFSADAIESVVIKANGVAVRNYVPCIRISDSKPGLYDLCNSTCSLTNSPFYINAGTGEFNYD